MTKFYWLFAMLFVSSNINAANEPIIKSLSNNEMNVSWNLNSDKIKIEKSKSQGPLLFSDINIEGWSLSKTVGSPSLPFKSVLLKGNPEDFKVLLNAKEVLDLDGVAPAPAQEMPCRCDIVPWKFNIDFNDEAYSSNERNHIFVEYMGMFKGDPITRVRFSPFSYNQKNGLRFIEKADIKIRSQKRVEKFSMNTADKTFYIFTPSKFKNSLKRLVSLRESQGFDVFLVTLEELGANFEEVQLSIAQIYLENKFSYSMIIGHEEIFPTEYVSTRFDDNTPSDMNYYTFDKDTSGQPDVIPDVLYSRISVDNNEELNRFIDKSIEFENRTWTNTAGSNQMMAIASDEGYDPTDVEYVRSMQRPLQEKFNWNSNEFFQENSDSTVPNISKQFNKGSIWLNYIGHGSGFAWPSIYGEEFTTEHIGVLKANAVKPVVIDVACQNGRFSNEGRMGESFIRATQGRSPAGAVAYYGGSVDISWDPPAIMAIGISKALSENNNRRLIDVLWQGQLYLLENYDDRQGALENFVWYHLQGDPLLNLSSLK